MDGSVVDPADFQFLHLPEEERSRDGDLVIALDAFRLVRTQGFQQVTAFNRIALQVEHADVQVVPGHGYLAVRDGEALQSSQVKPNLHLLRPTAFHQLDLARTDAKTALHVEDDG